MLICRKVQAMTPDQDLGTEVHSSAGWDEPRIASLLRFAALTPDEKLRWLEEMLGLMEALRESRHAQ